MRCTFSAHWKAFLFWPRVFSRALGSGARGGARVHRGASLGHGRAPWRVLWVFKSRELALFHRIAFLDAEAPSTM